MCAVKNKPAHSSPLKIASYGNCSEETALSLSRSSTELSRPSSSMNFIRSLNFQGLINVIKAS